MSKQVDWGKEGAIAAWIAIPVAIILWGIQYFWPSDAAHPPSLKFLTDSITVAPWLAILILFAIGAITAEISSRRGAKQAIATLPPPPPAPQGIPELDRLFTVHPTALDPRGSAPQPNIKYTSKLRLSFQNTGDQAVRVLSPQWLTGVENVSVQCGASPYPGVTYQEGMVEFGYRYQFEEYSGSWKIDKWKRLPNGDNDEQAELTVDPGQTFRIWVGLNPCVPHRILEDRRKTNRLGTLILPVEIGGKKFEWKQQL